MSQPNRSLPVAQRVSNHQVAEITRGKSHWRFVLQQKRTKANTDELQRRQQDTLEIVRRRSEEEEYEKRLRCAEEADVWQGLVDMVERILGLDKID